MRPFTKMLLAGILLASSFLHAQCYSGMFDGRFGFSAGGTFYQIQSDQVDTRSKPGYSFSMVGTSMFSDHFELIVEFQNSRNFGMFSGRNIREPRSPRSPSVWTTSTSRSS